MDGVQFVLHNPQYITEYTWGWSWAGLFVSLLSIIGIIGVVLCIKDKDIDGVFFMSLIAAVAFGTMAYLEFSASTVIETYSHSEYVVVVHEGVDCKEFFENYEVVGQNGDLITIKERSDDDT